MRRRSLSQVLSLLSNFYFSKSSSIETHLQFFSIEPGTAVPCAMSLNFAATDIYVTLQGFNRAFYKRMNAQFRELSWAENLKIDREFPAF